MATTLSGEAPEEEFPAPHSSVRCPSQCLASFRRGASCAALHTPFTNAAAGRLVVGSYSRCYPGSGSCLAEWRSMEKTSYFFLAACLPGGVSVLQSSQVRSRCTNCNSKPLKGLASSRKVFPVQFHLHVSAPSIFVL